MTRTTLALEEDLMLRLRRKAAEEGISINKLANRLLSLGLEASAYHTHQPVKWPSHPSGPPLRPLPSREALYDELDWS